MDYVWNTDFEPVYSEEENADHTHIWTTPRGVWRKIKVHLNNMIFERFICKKGKKISISFTILFSAIITL